MMRISAVLFDLDGALLDTLADIAHAANFMHNNQGHETGAAEGGQSGIGNGPPKLVNRALTGECYRNRLLVRIVTANFKGTFARACSVWFKSKT